MYEKYQKPDVLIGNGCPLVEWKTGLDLSDILTDYGLEKGRREGWADEDNKLVLREDKEKKDDRVID